MTKYVAAIDQGTTSTRCMIFDHSAGVISVHQREHEQIFPQPGWVEHDPMEIWARTQEVVKGALENGDIKSGEISAVGITNQRETTLVWNPKTGEPYFNAIVWQDTRTKEICDQLSEDGGQDRFRPKAGLPLTTYHSGPKLKWVLDNVDGVHQAAVKGEALFGNCSRGRRQLREATRAMLAKKLDDRVRRGGDQLREDVVLGYDIVPPRAEFFDRRARGRSSDADVALRPPGCCVPDQERRDTRKARRLTVGHVQYEKPGDRGVEGIASVGEDVFHRLGSPRRSSHRDIVTRLERFARLP